MGVVRFDGCLGLLAVRGLFEDDILEVVRDVERRGRVGMKARARRVWMQTDIRVCTSVYLFFFGWRGEKRKSKEGVGMT